MEVIATCLEQVKKPSKVGRPKRTTPLTDEEKSARKKRISEYNKEYYRKNKERLNENNKKRYHQKQQVLKSITEIVDQWMSNQSSTL